MSTGNGRTRMDLKVDTAAHPGWKTAVEAQPGVGDVVHCTEGRAEITKLLGKTSDGSRLLELKLLGVEGARPFFAAASNVLVAPPLD